MSSLTVRPELVEGGTVKPKLNGSESSYYKLAQTVGEKIDAKLTYITHTF
jgi:hypothetical protein